MLKVCYSFSICEYAEVCLGLSKFCQQTVTASLPADLWVGGLQTLYQDGLLFSGLHRCLLSTAEYNSHLRLFFMFLE